MKYLPNIAGGLLGLIFAGLTCAVVFHLMPMPPPPAADSLPGMFMGAFYISGYLTFIQVMEIVGGILVAIPKTRNFGLLVLGPIIVNILAYHTFIMKGEGLLNPMVILVVVLALFLLWCGRKAFAGLLR
jgi:putative oxidoreductase